MIRILLVCLLFLNCKQEVKSINGKVDISQNEGIEQSTSFDLTGKWKYVKEDSNIANVPEKLFTITISQKDNNIEAKYCAVANSGGKIDCEPDDENNIRGKKEKGKFVLDFYSFFGKPSDLGKAEISIIDENTIKWKVIKAPKSEYYAPSECILTRENNNDKSTDNSSQAILQTGNEKLPYDKTIDIATIKYDKVNSSEIQGLDEFSCGEVNTRYIPILKKGSIDVILVPQDCGDFPYRFLLLTIKDNRVKDNLYVEGEWYEPENKNETLEKTTFKIDINYKTIVKTNNIEEFYEINESGKFIKKEL